MMNTEQVILVDEQDVEVGLMDKMEAHQRGLLHRAFSVFIFNTNGDILLQQRAAEKYHSPMLWSNACCSHPRSGETTHAAAVRRIYEEMGIKCELEEAFQFLYKAEFSNNLTEHEYDHVFFGISDSVPVLNKHEVQDWTYVSISKLRDDIQDHPQKYTEWLKIIFARVSALRH